MKRLLSWLLALVMIISCLPMSVLPAFAAETDVETGTEDPDFGLDMWELLPGGSAENRLLVQFTMNAEQTEGTASVTVPAGMTLYAEYQGDPTYELSVDGVAHEFVAATGRNDTNKFEITNDTDAKKTYELKVALPVGTVNNRKVIETMEWYSDEVVQAAGDYEGYYYIYTATQTGDVTLYINAEYDDEGNVIEGNLHDITVTNLNTYAQYTLLNDGVDYYGLQLVVPVKAGQQLQINTSWIEDAAGNAYPAGTYSWTGNFTYPAGTENNPNAIEWNWNEDGTAATASVTVESDGQYYTGVAGMILTVNGVETEMSETGVFVLNAGTYDLVLSTPVGAYNNPVVIEKIDGYTDTNSLAADANYNYVWTATEAGTVTLTITEGANITVNKVVGVSEDGWPITEQYELAEPETDENGNYIGWTVAENLVIEVEAGQQLKIQVNGLTDWATWTTPAVTYTLTGDFEAAEPEALSPINFAAIEVSYDAEILLWLKFNIPADVLADDEGYFILTKYKGSEIKEQQQITIAELKEQGTDKNGRYILEQGIASPEMTAPVTVQFVDSYGRSVNIIDYITGEPTGTLTRCVLDYARLALEKGTDKQKKMVTALLVYGGYAQQYFSGFDSANPAYNLLNEFGIALPDIVNTISADSITQVVEYSGNTNIGIKHTSQQGFLDSAIYYEQYFTVDSGYSINDFKFEITYRNKDGSTYVEKVEPVFQNGKDRYIVTIYDIASIYLDHMYTITVTNVNTNEAYIIRNSVNAWLKRGLAGSKDVNQLNLFKAIYYYNQAANEFFGD